MGTTTAMQHTMNGSWSSCNSLWLKAFFFLIMYSIKALSVYWHSQKRSKLLFLTNSQKFKSCRSLIKRIFPNSIQGEARGILTSGDCSIPDAIQKQNHRCPVPFRYHQSNSPDLLCQSTSEVKGSHRSWVTFISPTLPLPGNPKELNCFEALYLSNWIPTPGV